MSGSAKRHALVLGAGGFIGAHLVRRLKREGFWVRGVDLEFPRFSETEADEFVQGDLRDQELCSSVIDRHFDEVYQFAADMGGAGYVFTGEHDADIIHNSATINLNLVDACRSRNIRKIFYSSSACVYPVHNQQDAANPNCAKSFGVSGGAGLRVRLGEALFRAPVPGLQSQSRHGEPGGAFPQYFRPGRNMAGRQRESAGGLLPKGRVNEKQRRNRNMGRRQSNAFVPVH